MYTYETAAHVALLDPENQAGIIICPNPDNDARLSLPSLHEADWDVMIRQLLRAGWLPLIDDWDLPVPLATLDDGRTVPGLYPDTNDLSNGIDYERAMLALVAKGSGE